MSIFSGLMKNKSLQDVFMKQLQGTLKDNNIKTVVLHVKEDGSFEPELFQREVKVIEVEKYNEIMNQLKNIL